MFSIKLFMCLLALCSCDALMRTCEDCIIVSSCPAAIRLATKLDGSAKSLFQNAFCGIIRINGKRSPKICCSDFTDVQERKISNEVIDDEIQKHKNIALLPESCGRVESNRIMGGQVARLNEFPWMTLISHQSKRGHGKLTLQFLCGGSIIHPKYVLTAAHCVKNKIIAGVRVGEFDLTTKVDCQGEYPHMYCIDKVQDIRVEKTIVHSDYENHPIVKNDIALIRLKKPIDFSNYNAAPICLPVVRSLRNITLSERIGTIAGWGTKEGKRESKVLLKVRVPILNDTKCSELYNRISNNVNGLDKKFCAGERGKDSCKGDSGGPLMLEEYNDTYRMYQYGIVSFGPSVCGTDTPGVYTDVTKYIKWILDNIEE